MTPEGPQARRRLSLRVPRELPHLSKENRQVWAVGITALLAQTAGAAYVGSTLIDTAWAALIGGGLAYIGTTAKRGPLLVAAMIAVVTSQTGYAVLLGLGAVIAGAFATNKINHRAIFARGLASGGATVSLLVSAGHRPGWHTAVAAVLVCGTIALSGFRHATKPVRLTVYWSLVGLTVFCLVASVGATLGIAQRAHTVDVATAELRAGLAFARAGDAASASGHLTNAAALMAHAQHDIDRFGAASLLVPGVAQQVRAVSGVLSHAKVVSDQAAVTALIATDDELQFRGGRIEPDIIAKLAHPLRRLSNDLGALVDEVDARLHTPLVPQLSDRLERFGREARRARTEAHLGAEAANVMPDVLGAHGKKHYLVLFTSPAEARGRFGFPGSFAAVTFDDGRMVLGEQASTSQTFQGVVYQPSGFDLTAPQLAPYLGYGSTDLMLNATISPDFPTVARVVAEQWRQSGREPVDGVLRLDPASLAPLLAFTGPVAVPTVPAPLTAANLEQFLIVDQYTQFPNDQAPRREVLDTVARVTFERLRAGNLPAPRLLSRLYAPLVDEGHFDVALFDKAASGFFDETGLDGRFVAPVSDGIAVTSVNSVGNKIDTFLTRAVAYTATVDGDQVDGTVSVQLTNTAPASGLPTYVIGSSTTPPLPKGTNRTTLFVYTRVRPRVVRVNGVRVFAPIVVADDRWLVQVGTDLAPGATAHVEVEVHGDVAVGPRGYELELEPGGGVRPDDYQVSVRVAGRRTLHHAGRVETPLTVR